MIYLKSMLRFAHLEAADNLHQKDDDLTLFIKPQTAQVNTTAKASITAGKKHDLYGLIFVENPEQLKHPLF